MTERGRPAIAPLGIDVRPEHVVVGVLAACLLIVGCLLLTELYVAFLEMLLW